MRTYGTAPEIYAPTFPLYALPAHLGAVSAPQAIATAGQVGGAVAQQAVTGAISTAATTSGSAFWGAAAGPIGAGVAVAIGLIAGLLAAHELRKKQAQSENAAVNLGVSGFDQGAHQIQQAFAAGQVDAPTAAQAAQLLLTNYWQEVAPHIQPQRNACNSGATCPGANIPQNYCSGGVGAGCCVGCEALERSINNPDGVLAALQGVSTSKNGPTTADIYQVFPSSYGTSGRAGYSLTFTPPAGGAAASASGDLSSIASAVPGGGTGLLLIALAVGALFLFR
jgi:hypothetical protein